MSNTLALSLGRSGRDLRLTSVTKACFPVNRQVYTKSLALPPVSPSVALEAFSLE